VPADLSSAGGREYGAAWEGIFQEVDIETGEVLLEWHSLEHVGVDESYVLPPEDPAYGYDYFHINSIDVDHDGNLLVSARNTWAVYKIDRESGGVLWRLGGKKSDFEMGDDTRTAFQHDARRHEDGTITIFDNGAHPQVHEQSRAILLRLDEEEMSATLLREYASPEKILCMSQGNAQLLSNGNVFVGWGAAPFLSEFSPDGEMLLNAGFPPECESYRAFRFSWSGHPTDDPALVAKQRSRNRVALHASWNGATEVAVWEVISGPYPNRLEPLGSVPRDGFETAILAQTRDPYVAVRARDSSGEVLGTSASFEL
jgi:Arylsulfotransferase (ASST)